MCLNNPETMSTLPFHAQTVAEESPRLANTEDESAITYCMETISNNLRGNAEEDEGTDVLIAQSLLLSSGYLPSKKIADVAEAIDDQAGVTASRQNTEEAEYREIGDELLPTQKASLGTGIPGLEMQNEGTSGMKRFDGIPYEGRRTIFLLNKKKTTVKSWRIRVCYPFYHLFFQETENGLWNLWMWRYQPYTDARKWRSVFERK
ncbi:hypothetical protein DPMN_161253, partial [Dreissena polymorpha]